LVRQCLWYRGNGNVWLWRSAGRNFNFGFTARAIHDQSHSDSLNGKLLTATGAVEMDVHARIRRDVNSQAAHQLQGRKLTI